MMAAMVAWSKIPARAQDLPGADFLVKWQFLDRQNRPD